MTTCEDFYMSKRIFEWRVDNEKQAQAIFDALWDSNILSTIINVFGDGYIVRTQPL